MTAAAPARPPAPSDVAWVASITAVKAAIIALAVDAFVNSNKPRFQGKAMKVRAVGYAGALLIVPVVWRLRGRRQPYPKELDLLVSLPLLADAGGNAIGMYQNAHVDDAIHFANGALLAGVVGSLAQPRTRTAWEAGAVAASAASAMIAALTAVMLATQATSDGAGGRAGAAAVTFGPRPAGRRGGRDRRPGGPRSAGTAARRPRGSGSPG